MNTTTTTDAIAADTNAGTTVPEEEEVGEKEHNNSNEQPHLYHQHRCLNNKEVGKQSEVFACATVFFFFLSLEYSYYDSCKFSQQNIQQQYTAGSEGNN
jgi:hypothetical protein